MKWEEINFTTVDKSKTPIKSEEIVVRITGNQKIE